MRHANGILAHCRFDRSRGASALPPRPKPPCYYWSDFDPGYYRPWPTYQQRQHKPRPHQAKKIEAPEKESAKPQGPLIIAISIEKQSLKIYDANGFFAETPISTGMKGHPTPMGVFSVIQKHKLHHSNIYSGAPMPFMQRITWSGVAMHAGVLPGYPASHGCIRMPMAFAVKMWNWTRMGARVVVTPGEMTPASFSHPLLVHRRSRRSRLPPASRRRTRRPPRKPTRQPPPILRSSPRSRRQASNCDRPSATTTAPSPRSAKAPTSTSSREQTQTADASDALPATKAPVTMTDATPSGGSAPQREQPAVETGSKPPVAGDAVKAGDATSTDPKPEAARSETARSEVEPATVKPGEMVLSNDGPVETNPSERVTAEIKPAEIGTIGEAGTKPDETTVTVDSGSDAASSRGADNRKHEGRPKARRHQA